MSYITYPKPTEDQCRAATSEAEKYRHLVAPFCAGVGVDVGTQGVAIVPWCISFDLPLAAYEKYAGTSEAKGPIHLRGDARDLPFEALSLDYVVSVHFLEDRPLAEWPDYITEWASCVKEGGYIIVLVPDRKLWHEHLANGGIPNANHQHEREPGDFEWVASQTGLELVLEQFTDVYPSDYTVMAVFRTL